MAGFTSGLDRWWRGSALYSLLTGSFFLRWLVGAPDNREVDYRSSSKVVAANDAVMSPCLRWLYRLGDLLAGWFKGSKLIQRWLLLAGIVVLLAAIVVLRSTLSWGFAAGIALIGLGLILTPNLTALVEGSLIGRLTTWWLHEEK